MPKPVGDDQKYLPGLDGLRALAVAAVIAYHLGYGWAQGGLLGVAVFFTLSGYLITDILAGQWAAHGRIKLANFWLRRARRLLPALLVMLAVVGVWVSTVARSFTPGFRGDVIASMFYISNWWYIGQHSSYYARFAPPAPLDHLWSLAVEEQFYLIWPWAVLLGVWLAGRRRLRGQHHAGQPGTARPAYLTPRSRKTLAAVTGGLAAASAITMATLYHPGYDPTRVYEGTDTRAFGLLAGAALALAWPTRRGRQASAPGTASPGQASARRLLDIGGVAGLAVTGLLVWRTNQFSPFMFRGGLVLASVATALVVAAVATPGSTLGRALGCRPLRWVGVRSYGIYLWHYPIIVLTAAAGAAGTPASPARAVALVAATVAAAALSWRFVEEPIRRGSRSRMRPAQAPAPADQATPATPADGGTAGATRRFGPLGSPLVIGGLCVLTTIGLTAGFTTVSTRLGTGEGNTGTGASGTAVGQPVSAVAPATATTGKGATTPARPAAIASPGTGHGSTSGQRQHGSGSGAAAAGGTAVPVQPVSGGTAGNGTAAGGAAGGAATVPALPTPPPQTSCTSVVHIGDSTSEGLISPNYLPNPADRITSRYADVGVRNTIVRVVGGTSIVETLPGTQNAYTMAKTLLNSGYHGCWVLALGTNDTADVYVGSNVDRATRIKRMMALIGDQPVMWVGVKSLLSSGPYSEQNMKLWDQALQEALPHYKNMRIYNWPTVVQTSWFINDGIHYTSDGYAHRATMIADALAEAFPAT